MIIDCFTVFNEWDLLEVRVNTLARYVDAFVLVEANRTFQGAEKPYKFDKSGVWHDAFGTKKPLYIVRADLAHWDMVTGDEGRDQEYAWRREHAQRRKLIDQLTTLSPNDRIILSDVDEIPNLEPFAIYPPSIWQTQPIMAWKQDLFYYWVNMRCWRWTGPVSCTWQTLREQFHCDLQALRDYRHRAPVVLDGGWHFSFLGGADAIKAKIEAFSHTEYRHCAEPANIERALREDWKENRDVFGRDNLGMKFEVMPDDSHLPAYLVANKERFDHWWYRPSASEEWIARNEDDTDG